MRSSVIAEGQMARHDAAYGRMFRRFLLSALLLGAAIMTACDFGPPVYRANGKLLFTSPRMSLPDSAGFFEPERAIILSDTMRQRVRKRMKKPADEVGQLLANVSTFRSGNTNIVVVSVDSPSVEFARDFANTLMDEYVTFREERRAMTSETSLLTLTREINRLSKEMRAIDVKLLEFAEDRSHPPSADLPPELQLLRKDREPIQLRYDTELRKLTRIEDTNYSRREVVVLEPAIVDPKPLRGKKR